MTTFALVHGTAHGAWSWDRLVPKLTARGHNAIVMDLPCEDNAAGFTAYADAVIRALEAVDDPVILVGHSFGGMTIPVVAARRPVKHLVFLAGLLPLLGVRPSRPDPEEPVQAAPGFEVDDHEDGTFSIKPASARSHLYNRCAPAVAEWAISRLRRQSRTPNRQIYPLTAWPDIDRSYIAFNDDRIVMPAYARYVASKRAGVNATVLDGDHSPFLSNVGELADTLIAFA